MATVSEVMTRGVRTLSPGDSVVRAAQAMGELNVGAIPVCEGDQLVGIVTDRDIVVRSVAQDCRPGTTMLGDVMSGNVRWARADDDVDRVLSEMTRLQIRRMPVVDARQRLVGILALGDVAAKDKQQAREVATSLAGISTPAAPDRSKQLHPHGAAGALARTGEFH